MINELMSFLDNSRTAFNGTRNIENRLKENSYHKLEEYESFNVEKGGRYYIVRNNSSILAFNIGEKLDEPSLHLCASHSDCPGFKLKPNALIKTEAGVKLNVEPYGGMLMNTWFDIPLGIAGRVCTNDNGYVKENIFDSEEMFCLIPSVAPHLTRGTDKKSEPNPQIDLLPLAGLNKDFCLEQYLAAKLGVDKEDVLSFDLYLYPLMEARNWGSDKELISSHPLDNLECGFVSLEGFINNFNENNINVYACFDNEEVGSLTRQGAFSDFLLNSLIRICRSLDIDYYSLTGRGMMLSIDNAHGLHPNHPELYDTNNHPLLNEGVVIKVNASQSYVSDSLSMALFKRMCDEKNIKYQLFANRSDSRGGSTLGNISNSNISLLSIDLGLASLAMHSSYETAGARDVEYLYSAVKEFYSRHLSIQEGKYSL